MTWWEGSNDLVTTDFSVCTLVNSVSHFDHQLGIKNKLYEVTQQ
jgi:hypothetical protein